MDKLLKDAIADAKAVRETAIANAKLALEEAFTPKLQSMLSAKIREEEDEMETDDEMGHPEEGHEMGHSDEMRGSDEMDTDDEMREMDTDDEMRGSDEMGHPEEGHHGGDEAPMDEPADDMELEAIIRELEDEMDSDDEGMRGEDEAMNEQSDSSDIGKGDNKVDVADGDDYEKAETEKSSKAPGTEIEGHAVVDKLTEEEGGDEEKEEEPVDLEEIIKSLSEDAYTAGVDDGEAGESVEKPDAPNKLKEAYATIQFMREKLAEVNLLNAKLLFTNKLFRNNGLDESQKLRVIETFDRAGSVREVKLVYSTLAESLKYDAKATKKVKKITEGLASKPSKTTKPASKQVINEGNELADRFKKLAGLIR